MKKIYMYVLNTMADWESGYLQKYFGELMAAFQKSKMEN